MADFQANDNTTCVVCFKNVLYYSIGECDHPVCFECSTRMRVLCLQNECPICRHDLSRVVFTDSVQPYKELRNEVFSDRLFERQFKIGFCSQEIKNAYDKLLENCCKICDKIPPFRTFSMLSDHMRKVHERYFCDLCVKHLRIFTSERKCYTRQELAHHRRKGDLDDTSHRGHPLCEFCEERFMDADELYRHLRKEHLYCHLCDADGRNLYYATHAALAQHFRTDHYLCEEGECAGQHLTAVFRSDIDLKAHKATIHGRGMTRNESRQARTLELQFNITPHPVAHQRQPRDRDRERGGERGGERDRGGERERDRDREREREQPASPPAQVQQQHIDTRSDEQFPRLSAAAAQPNLILSGASPAYRGSAGLARTNKNFPTLGGAPAPAPAPPRPAQPVASAVLRNSKPSVSIQLHSQPASASSFRLTPASAARAPAPAPAPAAPRRSKHADYSDDYDDEDFPSLGVARDDHPSLGASSLQPPKVTMINSDEMSALSKSQKGHHNQPKKAPLSSEAFPALSASAAPSAPPQWITKGKDKKAAKPEPPPPPKQLTFNPVADFPTLPITAKPKKSKAPQAQPKPEPPPEPIKLSKKDKKKQNSKKENISEFAYVNGVDKNIAKELSYGAASAPGPKPEEKTVKTVEVEGKEKKNGGNGDFALAARDYPPLNARSDNGPPSARKVNGAPPGFSKPRPACDGLKFTNSSGQTFRAPLHAYRPPPDFEPRNRALVAAFARALGRQASIDDFKVASRAFRDSIIDADEFYAHCRAAVGPQLDGLLGELVALLPDIAKQQELAVGRDVGLGVCATCGQLLASRDVLAHEQAHWPPLAR